MADINVPQWEYHDKNIQGSISQNDFTRADRVILYSAPTPLPGKSSNPMVPVGLIQSLTHNEQKQLQLFFELGSDAPMIIPGLTSGQLSITRVLLNGLNLLNAIYHGIDKKNLRDDQVLRSIRDINVPFDLLVAKYPVIAGDLATRAVESTLFRGCQFAARSETISAGGVVVMENASIQYTTIPKVTFNQVGKDWG